MTTGGWNGKRHACDQCSGVEEESIAALRLAKEGPVLILKGNEPDAVLVHLTKSLTDTESGVRPALAASLYRDGCVSLGKAAKISDLSLNEFIDHLGSLGMDVIGSDETTDGETRDLSAWRSS